MKRIIQALIAVFAVLAGLITVGVHAQASPKTVSFAGVTVEYKEPLFCPTNGNRLDTEFSINNGTGEDLLSLDIFYLDKYGQVVTSGFLASFKAGLTKTLRVGLTQYESSSLKCTDISKMRVYVDFYSTSSKSDTSIDQAIEVAQIGAPTPTPTPTPSVTIPSWVADRLAENDFQIERLASENRTLKAKIKKICSVKPKPKGC